jgi:hypothetical protein
MRLSFPNVSVEVIHQSSRSAFDFVGAVDPRSANDPRESQNLASWPEFPKTAATKGDRKMARLRRVLARIDLELIGEGLACASLFALLWCFLLIGHAWGLK